MSASYKLSDFLKECRCNATDVVPTADCIDRASSDLNLSTKQDVVEYVSNLDEKNLNFVNSKVWKRIYERTGKKIMTDAYHFFVLNKKYYLAFAKNLAGKWAIKSLHLDDNEIVNTDFKKQLDKVKKMMVSKGDKNE